MMDALRNQIIERKVIELVLAHAKFKDVPYKPEGTDAEAIDQAAGGDEESEIPEAKHPGEAEPLRHGEGTRVDQRGAPDVSQDRMDAIVGQRSASGIEPSRSSASRTKSRTGNSALESRPARIGRSPAAN